MAKEEAEELTADGLFQLVITRLGELHATAVIEEIEQLIAKGIVVSGQAPSSKTFRQLTSEEKLSVALECVVAAFDVPPMLARTKKVLCCDEVTWDSNQRMAPSASFIPEDTHEDALRKLVAIMDELRLPVPELA